MSFAARNMRKCETHEKLTLHVYLLRNCVHMNARGPHWPESTLVQVMAWCHQLTDHYLSQCWPISMSPYLLGHNKLGYGISLNRLPWGQWFQYSNKIDEHCKLAYLLLLYVQNWLYCNGLPACWLVIHCRRSPYICVGIWCGGIVPFFLYLQQFDTESLRLSSESDLVSKLPHSLQQSQCASCYLLQLKLHLSVCRSDHFEGSISEWFALNWESGLSDGGPVSQCGI